jgi:hypothetical protein
LRAAPRCAKLLRISSWKRASTLRVRRSGLTGATTTLTHALATAAAVLSRGMERYRLAAGSAAMLAVDAAVARKEASHIGALVVVRA